MRSIPVQRNPKDSDLRTAHSLTHRLTPMRPTDRPTDRPSDRPTARCVGSISPVDLLGCMGRWGQRVLNAAQWLLERTFQPPTSHLIIAFAKLLAFVAVCADARAFAHLLIAQSLDQPLGFIARMRAFHARRAKSRAPSAAPASAAVPEHCVIVRTVHCFAVLLSRSALSRAKCARKEHSGTLLRAQAQQRKHHMHCWSATSRNSPPRAALLALLACARPTK